ncbi:hypothetical protein BRAS3843_830035 [Bradyrhizobium sp. STM 3843]|nr:hypothetical protein BRAS3843_830035 [Bradyrhizobium sp. STM 3843]
MPIRLSCLHIPGEGRSLGLADAECCWTKKLWSRPHSPTGYTGYYGLQPANLDGGPICAHMAAIDTWPNDLGRFASPPTGAHVSDPLLQKSIHRQRSPPAAP